MAEGRPPHEPGRAAYDNFIDNGTNFSVNIGTSENVMIGNNCKLVVCSSTKSKSRKKAKIAPKFPVTDSKEALNNDEKLEVKGKVGRSWKDLGIRLGFENAELEQMEMDFRDDMSELIYQIITKWQQRVPEQATKAALAKVFIKMKRGDLADILAD